MILALLLAAQVQTAPASFPSKDRTATTLSATLYIPPDAPAKAPAIVVLHTCAGIDDTLRDWSEWLAQHGYYALMVDSFGPRHTSYVCGTRDVPARQRAFDAYGALAYLRTLPTIDAAHIGAIGFSHGGGAILFAENGDIAMTAGFASDGFAAAIALYPASCEQRPTDALIFPLLILMGASDDWTLAGDCEDLLKRSDSSGALGSIHLYDGTFHKFDTPGTNKVVKVGRNYYTLRYNPQAAADAHERVLAFFKKYLEPITAASSPSSRVRRAYAAAASQRPPAPSRANR